MPFLLGVWVATSNGTRDTTAETVSRSQVCVLPNIDLR